MILTLNLRANIILSHQFDVEWTLNIELCLLGREYFLTKFCLSIGKLEIKSPYTLLK